MLKEMVLVGNVQGCACGWQDHGMEGTWVDTDEPLNQLTETFGLLFC